MGDCVDLMAKDGVGRMRTETLRDALATHDPSAYGDLTVEELKTALAAAGAGKPMPLGPMGELTNPRGFKRETLTACL